MWSCFQELAEPEFVTIEQYLPLRNLRTRIMFDMEPGLNQIDNEVVRALERLLYTPSFFGRYLNAARYPLLMTTFVMRKPL